MWYFFKSPSLLLSAEVTSPTAKAQQAAWDGAIETGREPHEADPSEERQLVGGEQQRTERKTQDLGFTKRG